MENSLQINTYLHILAGIIALLLGALLLFSKKGSPFHRRTGKFFIPVGAVVITTAMIGVMQQLSHATLAAITLSASYQFESSLRALALRDKKPNLWDGFLAIGTLLIAAFMLTMQLQGSTSFIPAIGYSALGYVTIIAIYDLSRYAWAEYWSRFVRPIDHGFKMIGFYFSMLSAGAGNLLRNWQPWSQIIPSILGVLTLIIFTYFFIKKLQSIEST